MYPNVTKVSEKEFKAAFEVKTKALYDKLPVAFQMIRELLMESNSKMRSVWKKFWHY